MKYLNPCILRQLLFLGSKYDTMLLRPEPTPDPAGNLQRPPLGWSSWD